MSDLKTSFLHYLNECYEKEQWDASSDEVSSLHLSLSGEDLLLVKRWNWDYNEALHFQRLAQNFIASNRDKRIYIFTSHPHVFTMGRGLQKSKGEILEDLTSFDSSLAHLLPFPLVYTKRGGGLTFHYPGQWIFYPIVNLNHPHHNLKSLVHLMLDTVKNVLMKEYGQEDIDIQNKFLGVWKGPYKLASIGIGIHQFITYHGLALNLTYDQKMFSALKKVNPCGLSASVYRCLEQFLTMKDKEVNKSLLDDFHSHYLKELD